MRRRNSSSVVYLTLAPISWSCDSHKTLESSWAELQLDLQQHSSEPGGRAIGPHSRSSISASRRGGRRRPRSRERHWSLVRTEPGWGRSPLVVARAAAMRESRSPARRPTSLGALLSVEDGQELLSDSRDEEERVGREFWSRDASRRSGWTVWHTSGRVREDPRRCCGVSGSEKRAPAGRRPSANLWLSSFVLRPLPLAHSVDRGSCSTGHRAGHLGRSPVTASNPSPLA